MDLIRKPLRQLLTHYIAALGALIGLWGITRCYGYMVLWGIREQLRERIFRWIARALLFPTFLFATEMCFAQLGDPVDLVPLPSFIKVPITAFGVFMGIYRLRELNELGRESTFAPIVLQIFQLLGRIPKSGIDRYKYHKTFKAFVLDLFKTIYPLFEHRKIRMSLMTADDDGEYHTIVSYPSRLKTTVALFIGRGAGGKAARKKKPVYVPAVRYMHGMLIGEEENGKTELDFLDSTYPLVEPEPFQCLLCVPVRLSNWKFGIFSLDAPKQDVFNKFDIVVARIISTVFSSAFDRITDNFRFDKKPNAP